MPYLTSFWEKLKTLPPFTTSHPQTTLDNKKPQAISFCSTVHHTNKTNKNDKFAQAKKRATQRRHARELQDSFISVGLIPPRKPKASKRPPISRPPSVAEPWWKKEEKSYLAMSNNKSVLLLGSGKTKIHLEHL
ncbi:hypothetical protein JR316_0012519 [Psilocybe cubensis]|uniref:Uncharacterized protein n=1 Tax=Psilocybe cubensis TaxID=181762 RepID=A0ACB8GIP5_PSICU|nr:hypothetical protein JR316_0012519 [Psilocybe cubensis]KAH9475408.1 hypothetical protein JR316_0012519 [Psilocybe cubensis]